MPRHAHSPLLAGMLFTVGAAEYTDLSAGMGGKGVTIAAVIVAAVMMIAVRVRRINAISTETQTTQ